MTILEPNPSLQQIQEYVAMWEKERGFADESALQKCLLLGEEIGELFKAIRKSSGIKVDPYSTVNSVGEELADVLMFLVAIANRYQIDLEASLRATDKKNRNRIWN